MDTRMKVKSGKGGSGKGGSGKGIREDYKIKMCWMEEIQRLVGGGDWLDVFATEATARFKNMMAPKDAFAELWDGGWTHWVNPPFSCLERVMLMILRSVGRVVCLIPDWGKTTKAVEPVLRVAEAKWYIPSGSRLFEGHYGPNLGATRWGCWLILIEAGQRWEDAAADPYQNVTFLPWNRTGASRALRQQERDRLWDRDVHRVGKDCDLESEIWCSICGEWTRAEREMCCDQCGVYSLMAVDFCGCCGC
jgi:hypothetical protein